LPGSALSPGDTLGEYVLGERIAAGGFGEVWRATGGAGAPVAIKVLHAELITSSESVARFEREVEVVRRIAHPGLVDIRATGTVASRPYAVMELLSGRSLSELIAQRAPLPPAEVAGLVRPICEALQAAHAEGVIHRDLKASNVMLCDDGRVVLLDFGVAKLLDAGAEQLTRSRRAVGTPACMAPEQIRGEAVDARTDVYGLGALLFELLTGKRPFAEASALTGRYLSLHGRRPRPSEIVPVAPAVDDIVVRAMAKAPADRFAGPMALADALDAAVAPVAEPAAHEVTAGAVLVRAHLEADAAGDGDALDDFEDAIALAGEALRDAGLAPVWSAGDAALYAGAGVAGLRLEEVARAASDRLGARAGKHPAVRVGFSVHVGDALERGGRIVGGALLDVAAWPAEEQP